jgi:K+-sensing histidine kinase KdpD
MVPRPADLNDIVHHIQKFLVRIIGEDIQLKSILNGQSLPVTVDSGQVEQVLVNLATNARDAMTKGGVLTLETGLQEVDTAFIHAHGYGVPGRYAVVTVSDTGCGMDEKTFSRIFEPFFTTKELGKGTGLGMAIVYGIIRQHNGFINVYSEPGHGTTFRVYLPIVETEQTSHGEKTVQATPQGGCETILLAEDGQEAVEKFAANRESIRLILMDMIMPKKNGKEAYDEICRLKPGRQGSLFQRIYR